MKQEMLPESNTPKKFVAGLKEASVESEPNPAPFMYADYAQAQEVFTQAIMGTCFYTLIIGKSGMGKTCLFEDSVRSLDRHRQHITYISAAHASVNSIARVLAIRLHVTPRRSFLENVQVINEAIFGRTSHMVVWLDEAEQMETSTLSELRMLAESDPTRGQSFSVVLSGLPELKLRLDSPDLFPLKRRITHRLTLTGLRRDELDPFLVHRFGNGNASLVPEAVKDELFERTQATPALVNQIIRQALAGHNPKNGVIDENDIRTKLDTAGL